MSRAKFLKGVKIRIDGREYVLLRQIANRKWILEDSASGEIIQRTNDELLDLYIAESLTFVLKPEIVNGKGAEKRAENAQQQFEMLPSEKQDEAKRRRAYVTAILKELGPQTPVALIDSVAAKIRARINWPEEAPPHRITIWRWVKRYVASGNDIRSLVTQTTCRGNRERRLPERLIEIIDASVEEIYLTEERRTIQDTLDHAIVETKRENSRLLACEQLPLPSTAHIKSAVARIPEYDRYAARHGKLAADRHFRAAKGGVATSRPLERVEIDHTRMDIFVVDDECMLPLGRPWLTLCIDGETRAILGYDLSFDAPSHSTVARCLRMALLPKPKLSELYASVKNSWEMYGVPETLIVDNGMEFHSESLEAACLSLGITIQFCPRKRPWFKGKIERVQGSLNRGVAHGHPGTTFENIVAKEDYDVAKKATVTLNTLREMIYVWIVDYYHQRVHRGLGDTPAHAWKIGTAAMDLPLPADKTELDAVLGKIDSRLLTHKGIEINGLFYNSEAAGEIRRRLGEGIEVSIRHHDDLGHIHILVPDTQQFLHVPAVDQDYAKGLTLWQHKIFKRYARKNLNGRTDPVALAEAKERIRQLVADDYYRKGKKSRLRNQKLLTDSSGNPTPAPKAPTSSPQGEPLPEDNPTMAEPSVELNPTPSLTSAAQALPRLSAMVVQRNTPSQLTA